MKNKKKLLSIILAICILLINSVALAQEEVSTVEEESKIKNYTVTRIEGKDRYDTAINIAKGIYLSDTAFLASGENFADALFGGPFAAQLSAPIFLTNKDELPENCEDSFKELGVKWVYILGGENTISKNLEETLKEKGYGVSRIAGDDRYETAALINKHAGINRGVKILGDLPSIYVSGEKFADALSSGPLAYLLQNEKAYGRFLPYSGLMKDNSLVIGGESSVKLGKEKARIAGDDRYETSLKVAEEYKKILKEEKNIELKKIVIASGENYPDALAACPLACANNAPILLTVDNKLDSKVVDFIKENKIEQVIIVGGENSVSREMEDELKTIYGE